MPEAVTISKELFINDLYNSSSYEDVIDKIEKEKSRVEQVKNLGQYVPLASLHLEVVGEIKFYMENGVPKNERDPNLNDRIAEVYRKFPVKK